jgi:hypothetical protein
MPVEPKAPAPSHELPKAPKAELLPPKVEAPKVVDLPEVPKIVELPKSKVESIMKKPSEVKGTELERTRVFPRY